jgi:hypothetical protein
MHQLGLTAAELAGFMHGRAETALDRLSAMRNAHLHAGCGPEEAERLATLEYLQEFATDLLLANNRKIASDLVRLGVISGTLTAGGDASF